MESSCCGGMESFGKEGMESSCAKSGQQSNVKMMGRVYLHRHRTGMNAGGMLRKFQFLNSKCQLLNVEDATFVLNG